MNVKLERGDYKLIWFSDPNGDVNTLNQYGLQSEVFPQGDLEKLKAYARCLSGPTLLLQYLGAGEQTPTGEDAPDSKRAMWMVINNDGFLK